MIELLIAVIGIAMLIITMIIGVSITISYMQNKSAAVKKWHKKAGTTMIILTVLVALLFIPEFIKEFNDKGWIAIKDMIIMLNMIIMIILACDLLRMSNCDWEAPMKKRHRIELTIMFVSVGILLILIPLELILTDSLDSIW